MQLPNTLSEVYSLANEGTLEKHTAANAIKEILLSGESLEMKTAMATAILAKLDKRSRVDVQNTLYHSSDFVPRLSDEERKAYNPILATVLFRAVKLFPAGEQKNVFDRVYRLTDDAKLKKKATEGKDRILEETPDSEKFELAMEMSEHSSDREQYLAIALKHIGNVPVERHNRAMRIYERTRYGRSAKIAEKARGIAIKTLPDLSDGNRYEPALKLAGDLRYSKTEYTADSEHEVPLPKQAASKIRLVEMALADIPASLQDRSSMAEYCDKLYRIYRQTMDGSQHQTHIHGLYKDAVLAYITEKPKKKEGFFQDTTPNIIGALSWGQERGSPDSTLQGMVQDIVLDHVRSLKGQDKLYTLITVLKAANKQRLDFAPEIEKEIIQYLRKLKPQERFDTCSALITSDRIDLRHGNLKDLLDPVSKMAVRAFGSVIDRVTDPEQRFELAKKTYNILELIIPRSAASVLKVMAETVSDLPEDKKFDAHWTVRAFARFHDNLDDIMVASYAYLVKALPTLPPEKLYFAAFHMSSWGMNTEETAEKIYGMIFPAIEKLPLNQQREAAKEIRLTLNTQHHWKRSPKYDDLQERTQAVFDRIESIKHPPLSPDQFLARMATTGVSKAPPARTLDYTSGE